MVVGVCTIQLRIAASRSLKDRRRVVRRIRDRLRARFNASVSEVDPDDSWDGASLGIAVVAPGRTEADGVLRKILDHVEWLHPGVIHDYLIEFL